MTSGPVIVPDALRVTGLWAPSTLRATPYCPAGRSAPDAGRGTVTVVASAVSGGTSICRAVAPLVRSSSEIVTCWRWPMVRSLVTDRLPAVTLQR